MTFSLRLSWNNGSLPPPYRTSGIITLPPDGRGTVERFKGYGNEAVETVGFTLGSPEALVETLRAGGLWRTDWQEHERPTVGGATVSLRVTLDGETLTVPTFVVPEQREAKKALVQAVRDAVPSAD